MKRTKKIQDKSDLNRLYLLVLSVAVDAHVSGKTRRRRLKAKQFIWFDLLVLDFFLWKRCHLLSACRSIAALQGRQ